MLSVENLNVYYGAIHALHDISFHVDTGEIVTLIGANGAGKTSILQSISALIPRRSGAITFDGKDLSHIPAHRLISMGLTQVPEGRRVFATMTVMENLEMGAYTRRSRTETIKGTVTVSLNEPLDHQGSDRLSLGLSISAREIDGDETRADLQIAINDGTDPSLGLASA